MRKIIIWVLFLIIGVQNVFGLGIAPASKTINFKSGLEEDISVIVINRQNTSIDVDIRKEGELSEYIKLDTTRISFKDGESRKSFSYMLSLPSTMGFGEHEGEILVSEVVDIEEGEAIMTAKVEVGSKLIVRVPYPGKHAKAELKSNVEERSVVFTIPLVNIGTEDITVKAKIKIFGREEAEIETSSIEIKSLESTTLSANWKATFVGAYKALIEVYYGDKVIELQDEFNIGEAVLEVEYVLFDKIKLGEVAEFNIIVNSSWNKIVRDVYADVIVKDKEGDIIQELKTTSEDIDAFSKKNLTAYWNTKKVKAGAYDLIVKLNYDGKVYEKKVEVNVEEELKPEKEVEPKPMRKWGIIIAIIIVLVWVMVILYEWKKWK